VLILLQELLVTINFDIRFDYLNKYQDIVDRGYIHTWIKKHKYIFYDKNLNNITAISIFHGNWNKIDRIPRGIKYLTNLKTLRINGAVIKKIENIFDLPLEYLELDYNAITKIPKEIEKIQTLKYLSLESNNIKTIPNLNFSQLVISINCNPIQINKTENSNVTIDFDEETSVY
jgi:hypothetical protein